MKEQLLTHFQGKPTDDQDLFLSKIADFLQNRLAEIFVLKGYAGTGKSTLTKTIINTLEISKRKTVLLAPTGRAAKVLGQYAQKPAATIHSHLYHLRNNGGSHYFALKPNKFKNTLFIVDEASMITNQAVMGNSLENNSLLDDLIRYVFQPGANNQLLFIGDEAQLPPVHLLISPALESDELHYAYQKAIVTHTLTEVVRQQQESTILENATYLRELLHQKSYNFQLKLSLDCQNLKDRYEIESAISDSLMENPDEVLIIVRANKRANLYNQQIREQILMRESRIERGDKLMVVRNNYFWVKENSPIGFIANGEMMEVLKVHKVLDLYGFSFAEVLVSFPAYPNEEPLETIVLLDTLQSETPSLTSENRNELYYKVLEDYEAETSKAKKLKKVKENVYFNALEVKFAYAVTCHKAQGGQWDTIFVEQPYAETYNESYIRWLYTALTRAKQKLFLLGFKPEHILED